MNKIEFCEMCNYKEIKVEGLCQECYDLCLCSEEEDAVAFSGTGKEALAYLDKEIKEAKKAK